MQATCHSAYGADAGRWVATGRLGASTVKSVAQSNDLGEAAMKHILVLALMAASVGACASESQRQARLEPRYYEPPLSGAASVQPAIIEGTIEQTLTRGGLPAVLYEPEAIDRLCAYVFSVDGQMVGERADCTTAVPVSPGKHVIAAWLQGDRYSRAERQTFRPATATLMFDAEEGHHYKISMDRMDFTRGSARIWIHDVTTQTSVTEARLVTPQVRPWGGPDGPDHSGNGDVAFEHDK